MSTPIVAVATAPGRAAVGIVRVSGIGLQALIDGVTIISTNFPVRYCLSITVTLESFSNVL